MPYTNMPKDKWPEMERCVKSVTAKGKPKKNAVAICYASIMGGKKKDSEDEFILDATALDPALLVEGMDVEETAEAEGDLKAWVKEQFDALRESIGLKAKPPKMTDCPECGKKMPEGGKCPDCGYEAEDDEEEEKSLSEGSMVYKDAATGAYRWLAVFTNKFRDRDNPPEIICDAAHRDFVKAVNAGEWPMPEYRLWHIPAPIGRADFLAYHDAGFVVASGTITKGLEPVAEMMAAVPFRWINSHGMPVSEIRRDDPQDKTIITRYRSKEITALPEWAAANELTLNLIETEEKMAGFSDNDRERLSKMFGDKAATVEELLTRTGEKATEAGVESKEVKEEPAAEQPKEEASAEQQPPSRAEVADVMKPVVDAMRDLADQLAGLKKELADYKAEAEQKEKARAEETLARTPAASLSELLAASITKSLDNEARVKGRTGLKGPVEAPEKPPAPTGSGGAMDIPFIAKWMQASKEGAAKTEQL